MNARAIRKRIADYEKTRRWVFSSILSIRRRISSGESIEAMAQRHKMDQSHVQTALSAYRACNWDNARR